MQIFISDGADPHTGEWL